MTHVGPKHYAAVFAVLLVLTAVTVFAAYQDFGAFNTIIALGIAVIKAGLVISIFMHVRWSGALVAVFAVSGFLWVGIMIVLVLADMSTRAA